MNPQEKADQIRDRRIQEQTAAWLTDDGELLVRKYGDTMTVTAKVDGRWSPEQVLTPEPWDFGATA